MTSRTRSSGEGRVGPDRRRGVVKARAHEAAELFFAVVLALAGAALCLVGACALVAPCFPIGPEWLPVGMLIGGALCILVGMFEFDRVMVLKRGRRD